MQQVTSAVDKVRRQEHKKLMAEGDDRLKGTKHLWLMNEEKIPDWRKEEFDEIRKTELKNIPGLGDQRVAETVLGLQLPKECREIF